MSNGTLRNLTTKLETIDIAVRGQWKIVLVECQRPYPLLFKDGQRVNVLFNTAIPQDVRGTFWHLLSEHNKFLECEPREVDEIDYTYSDERPEPEDGQCE